MKKNIEKNTNIIKSNNLDIFHIIDFHTHILSGIDDGSKCVEESINILKEQWDQHIDIVVATPHFLASQNTPEAFFLNRKNAADNLLKAISQLDNRPKIAQGAEIRYFRGISQCDKLDLLKIMGTNLLLIEMPFFPWSKDILKELYDLYTVREFKVIIAHIERYLTIQKKSIINELFNMDVFIQANAEFFLNWYTRRKALNMLEKDQIHLLGSDCHNLNTRPPNIRQAIDIIYKYFGEYKVKQLYKLSQDLLINAVLS